MDLYTLDDGPSNATTRRAVLRPVRTQTVAQVAQVPQVTQAPQQMGYPPPWYGRGYPQGYWQGPPGGYAPPGAFAGPWRSMMTGQKLANGLATLVEGGAGIVAAFTTLPEPPDADDSDSVANLTEYQTRLAKHAQGDERLRTIAGTAAKLIKLAGQFFDNPMTTPSAYNYNYAQRWY